jgi:4-carboxymuconolactone decarboxylase
MNRNTNDQIDNLVKAVDSNLDHFYRQSFKTIFSRPGLDLKIRLLCSMGALIALGDIREFRDHVRLALRKGITTHDIRELFLQSALFVGFPRVITFFRESSDLLFKTYEEEPVDIETDSELARYAGEKILRKIYRDKTDTLLRNMSLLDEDFADWLVRDAYGKILSRVQMDIKDRELISISILLTLKRPRQLKSHMRGAFNTGASFQEIKEVLLQLVLYVGYPDVIEGLITFRELFPHVEV